MKHQNNTWFRLAAISVAFLFMFPLFVLGQQQEDFQPYTKWVYGGDFRNTTPVIADDGTVLAVSGDGGLCAIDPEGNLKWRNSGANSGNPVAAAIGPDGTIYCNAASSRGGIRAYSQDGKVKWLFTSNYLVKSSPAVGPDSTIYVGSQDGFLYALNPDGTLKWKCKAGRGMVTEEDSFFNIESSPAVGPDGTIYVTSKDSYIYAINPFGTVKWKYPCDYFLSDGSPAVGLDGTVYAASVGSFVYAINPDGTLRWKYPAKSCGYSSPVIAADGTVYIGSFFYKGNFFAITPDGNSKWIYEVGSRVESSAVIGNNGTVYVIQSPYSSDSCAVHAVNPDGTLLWNFYIDIGDSASKCQIDGSPALAPDGTLYVGSSSGLYAIQTDTYGLQADAPWPWFMQNNKRSIASNDFVMPQLWRVYGQVAAPDSVSPAGIEVSVNGLTTETNQDDSYELFLPDGTYTLIIDMATNSYPGKIDFIVSGADVHIVPEMRLFQVIGRILEINSPCAGIGVTVGDTTVVTDQNGRFAFQLPDGFYTLRAGLDDGNMPDSRYFMVSREDVEVPDIQVNKLLWNYDLSLDCRDKYPLIAPDGSIYLTNAGMVVCLNPDGTLRNTFQVQTQGSVNPPALGNDGILYIPCFYDLVAYSTEGEYKWSFPVEEVGMVATPAIGKDGTIYLGSNEAFYGINPNGTLRWKYQVGNRAQTSPAIGADGTVYFASWPGSLYAFDSDGVLQWRYDNSQIFAPPVIGRDGVIYAGSYDRFFYALNPDGTIKWKYETENAISRPAVIDTDGTIYLFSNQGGNLYALNPDGTLKWSYQDPISIDALAITSENTLMATAHFGKLYSFNTDGTMLWSHEIPDYNFIYPSLGTDGIMYLLMRYEGEVPHKELRAFQTSYTGYQKNAPWPVEMANNRHTSTVEEPVTAVEDNSETVVSTIVLEQNTPNPFNASTIFRYTLSERKLVSFTIYNIAGQQIRHFNRGIQNAGTYEFVFDGAEQPSGVYFARIEAGTYATIKRMLLLR